MRFHGVGQDNDVLKAEDEPEDDYQDDEGEEKVRQNGKDVTAPGIHSGPPTGLATLVELTLSK
ncbi:hypothetical protein D3C81_2222230 [compost metagenome]